MKTCFKCRRRKPFEQFYRHPMMGDGYLGKCKACTKKDVQANYRARIERYREYDRERNKRPERKADKLIYEARARKRSPGKSRARVKAARAYRAGLIPKGPCIHCASENTEMHHRDYRKPLDVVWVCHRCHITIEHKKK